MPHIIADRVRETTSTTGTGHFTLTGAVPGFDTFVSALADTDTTWYCAESGVQWEVGVGTKSSGTLERTTILSSSNSDAIVDFIAAPNVFITIPAAGINDLQPTLAAGTSVGQVLRWNGSDWLPGIPGFTVAVVGDSISAEYPMLQESWPGLLERKLHAYGMAGASVINCAIGASTYAASNDAGSNFKFGTRTQVQHAVSFTPDVLIFMYGANDVNPVVDSLGDIDSILLDAAVAAAVAAITYVHTNSPNTKIVIVEEELHDADHPYWADSETMLVPKNRSIIPYLWDLTGGIIDATLSAAPMTDAALGRVDALRQFYDAIYADLTTATIPYMNGVMPYFKVARLGGLSIDLLHPNAAGMTAMATKIADILIDLEIEESPGVMVPLLPYINVRDYSNQFNGFFNTVFNPANDGLPDDEGVRVESYENNFNYLDQGFFYVFEPALWYYPSRPKVVVSPITTKAYLSSLTIIDAISHSTISVSFNGGSWIDIGTTDETGSLQAYLNLADAVSIGNNFVRIRFSAVMTGGPTFIRGPYEIDSSAGRNFQQRRIQTVGSATGAVTCEWALYDEIRLTLTGDVVLTFTGAVDGQGCTLKIIQGGAGSHDVTLDGDVRFSEDITAYIPSTAATKGDRLGFIRDSADSKYDFVSIIKGF